ncbi:nitroreductase [Aliiroseovarius sp. S1339]|uniref:nitroreductase n=1 Tax=Aliiroseovarius sp. S1339 TaxID=2936990 RepID=UPI0020BDFA61|nr:nitroreductase [Aliiroseovarius sp. S1339]MCK8464184.1 nitroreductase [Aliiroseovarius sp. S1339]
MHFEDFSALLSDRFSCRAFRPDPVAADVITQILTAAQKVPSWCNAQPWQVDVTTGTETDRLRAALYDHAMTGAQTPDVPWPSAYTGKHQARRKTCGLQLYESVGVARGDRAASARQMMENFHFFGAPHMALVTAPAELGAYAYLDCGGFVTGFTLAATALGVASIPQAAVTAYAPFLRDWFKLPGDRTILCGISFGYADDTHPANGFRTDRAPLDEWVRLHGPKDQT